MNRGGLALVGLAAVACGEGATPARIDAAPAIDATPPAPTHVLLTEIYTQVAAEEFVELANPTAEVVDLSTYYLADDPSYALLPAAGVAVSDRDFVVRFPAGASLAPGEVITVARSAEGFEARYGAAPDFGFSTAGTRGAMELVAVGAFADFSDVGEIVVVFAWDGAGDLVTDVDLVAAGIPNIDGERIEDLDKTGLAVDGPDADTEASVYAPEAITMPRFDLTTSSAESYKRLAIEGFAEVHGDGNGVDGDDETSEDLRATWGQGALFTAPTPGRIDGTWLP